MYYLITNLLTFKGPSLYGTEGCCQGLDRRQTVCQSFMLVRSYFSLDICLIRSSKQFIYKICRSKTSYYEFKYLERNRRCTICFVLGETMVSLQKTALIPGGSDSMVYTTLSGIYLLINIFLRHYS